MTLACPKLYDYGYTTNAIAFTAIESAVTAIAIAVIARIGDSRLSGHQIVVAAQNDIVRLQIESIG